jgi:hypothetical protein
MWEMLRVIVTDDPIELTIFFEQGAVEAQCIASPQK